MTRVSSASTSDAFHASTEGELRFARPSTLRNPARGVGTDASGVLAGPVTT